MELRYLATSCLDINGIHSFPSSMAERASFDLADRPSLVERAPWIAGSEGPLAGNHVELDDLLLDLVTLEKLDSYISFCEP